MIILREYHFNVSADKRKKGENNSAVSSWELDIVMDGKLFEILKMRN